MAGDTPKVVSLHGGEIPPAGEPRPSVVAAAERILEMARSGEINGLAAVLRHSDECTSSSTSGAIGRMVLGQLSLMQAEIAHDLLKEDGRI